MKKHGWLDDNYGFKDSSYVFGDNEYPAHVLYKAAKEQECEKYKLPIDHIDLSWPRFDGANRIIDMAYHCNRVNKADLKYPILIGPLGEVMDGAHRIVKALCLGKKFVWAIKLKELPEPIKRRPDTECNRKSESSPR